MAVAESHLLAPQRSGRGATRRNTVARPSPRLQGLGTKLVAGLRRLLVGGGAVAVLATVILLAPELRALVDKPVARVEVQGELMRLDASAVRSVINRFDLGSLFGLDLQQMRVELEAMPWVRLASVRRVWPDTLQVQVVEQTPIAVWNAEHLINEQGEVFSPGQVGEFSGLPGLNGPEGSGTQLMQGYQRFSLVLQGSGLQLASLHLNARGAWDIRLDNGVHLRLGRDDVLSRLQRFALLHERHLAARIDEVDEVDARYEQGLAVRWKASVDETKG